MSNLAQPRVDPADIRKAGHSACVCNGFLIMTVFLGGKIAAVVISLLFAVGILVAVIPAIFMYRKLKEHIRRKRGI